MFKKNKEAEVIAATSFYLCGCTATYRERDAAEWVSIDYCSKHAAADKMYKALKFALPSLRIATQTQASDDYLALEMAEEAIVFAERGSDD